MQSDDVVDPVDAALHQMLGHIADNTEDEGRRDRVRGLMLTLPPIAEWPPQMYERWHELHDYIRGCRRELEQRQLEQMFEATGNGGSH
ncbi:hypothetical protein ACTXG5_25535 [Mycobacterium sp. Dal123C01]|uniref:hypothetical protein n=1 Tax=Mycobacterium sp. Dal123C01 TaxID=3457577 RepID=UPI00403EC604